VHVIEPQSVTQPADLCGEEVDAPDLVVDGKLRGITATDLVVDDDRPGSCRDWRQRAEVFATDTRAAVQREHERSVAGTENLVSDAAFGQVEASR
jgi:hypothetical protein